MNDNIRNRFITFFLSDIIVNIQLKFTQRQTEISISLAKKLTLIGASNDFATLTITGVKKTQKMSYTNRPACKIHECKRVKDHIEKKKELYNEKHMLNLLITD